MPRNALAAGGVFEPDPTNPLTGSYTAADAADWHSQNVRDAWAAAKDPQTWQDAADQYRSAMLMGSVAPEMKAAGLGRVFYHGMPGPMEGTALRASDRGYFGPGVYLSEQPGVAGSYGSNVVKASVDGDLFQAWPNKGTLEQDPGAHEKILAGLAPSEREAVRSLQGWYRNDSAAFYQALSRSASPASAQKALAKAGYAGIEGIGDGHEIAVFDPSNVKVQTAGDHPLATNAAPEMTGLGLDAAGMKVLRDMTPGANAAVMDNPAFAKWFGKSKAVDEAGNPATYYHGTNSDFDTFQRIDGGNQYGEGHYFTKNPRDASGYATGDVNRITPEGNAGPNVMPVKLAFDKPYDRRGILSPADIQSLERAANAIDPGRWKRGELARMFDKPYPPNGDNVAYELGSNANEIIRKAGFDAFVDPHMTVVFKPTQIKSAIGNSGKFDPKDPRITAGLAGLMAGGGAAAGVNAGNSE